ncbi:CHAT domain-containing protein [Aquimarina sp. 2304DJ70-9]|uniref:CHAT domain-containing protein n=1 Tax=Aquimarina penaris TaxID=3231044 RepID=UPI0034630B4F
MQLHTNLLSVKTIITISLILLFNPLQAQTIKDTILASQYYKKGDSIYSLGKYFEAIEDYKKAIVIYQKARVWEKVAFGYNSISYAQFSTSEYKKALSNAQKALRISTTSIPKSNKEEATAYDNIGRYYMFIVSDYDTAQQKFEKALSIRKKTLPKNDYSFKRSYYHLGHLYLKKAMYNKALKYFKEVLSLEIRNGKSQIQIAESYVNISRIYYAISEYDKFRYYSEKVLNIRINTLGKNHIEVGYAYGNMGLANHVEGNYEKALYYYEKSFAIEVKSSGENSIQAINHYINTGTLYKRTGNYDKALQYAKKALATRINILGKDHIDVAQSYGQVGEILHKKGLNSDALNYFEKGLAIYINAFGNNHPEITDTYIRFGNVYQAQKQYHKALEYYEKALTIETNTIDVVDFNIANLYNDIGQVYLLQKQYNKALTYYTKSLDIRLKMTYHDSNLVLNYNSTGEVFEKKKAYNKALFHYKKALLANLKTNAGTVKKNTLDPNRYKDLNLLLSTHKLKARTLISKYQDSKNQNDLTTAITTYQYADSLINIMRQTIDYYEDKIIFAKESQEIYSDAINTNLLMHKTTQDDKFLNKAFYYAEKNKSNTLKELLIQSNAKNFSEFSTDIITLEKDLKTNRAFYQSKISEEQFKQPLDTIKILKYENKLFDIGRRQDSVNQIIEKNNPKYHQLKHKNNIISVAEIQEKLDKHTTMIEFFTTDSITYAFTISKIAITVNKLQIPQLAKKTQQLHNAITLTNTKEYKRLAYLLYKELIAPISNKFIGNQLIIIPDGSLWHLNFDLLLSQNDTTDNAKEFSYLLKDYAISYANSAHLLYTSFKSKQQESKIAEECLAFSFSDSTAMTATNALRLSTLRNLADDLPGTRKEIKAISEIIDGQYYFGSQAIEANFKKNASQYNILHLALHGELDNEHPENSKLLFNKIQDSIEDNYLYSHELFALDIPAELTVLSACNTGSGKIAKGEGIMSLGNAFQYAGTKSLLLTSWEISDRTTPELMTYFYTNLKKGMTKSKALQQAKLKYINTADSFLSAPFYWGGFYLVGDASPIQFKSNANLYWTIGLFILGILVLSLLIYTRKWKKN